jgi:hypothetical protein
MKRLGLNSKEMRDMNHNDTFIERLKLLIIMVKAFLGDYTLEGYRLRTISRNADEILKICNDWNRYIAEIRSTHELKEGLEFDHIFHQRASLLAIVVQSFAVGNPMGQYRERVIKDNIDYICTTLEFNLQPQLPYQTCDKRIILHLPKVR